MFCGYSTCSVGTAYVLWVQHMFYGYSTCSVGTAHALWVQHMFLARGYDNVFDSYNKNQLDALMSQIDKLVHLVGFIIRFYNDARSRERQHFRYSLYIVPVSF